MKKAKNIGIYVVIFGLVLAMVWFYNSGTDEEQEEIRTSKMIEYLQENEVRTTAQSTSASYMSSISCLR